MVEVAVNSVFHVPKKGLPPSVYYPSITTPESSANLVETGADVQDGRR